MTYTYAILEVSPGAFEEVASQLRAADGYERAFHKDEDGVVIDMHGIALRSTEGARPANMLDPTYIDALCLDVSGNLGVPHEAVTIGRRVNEWVCLIVHDGRRCGAAHPSSPAQAVTMAQAAWRDD